jgi:hypothetical protein
MTYTDESLDGRIRSAAPHSDAANWADVRRRARRKRIPAALAVGVVAATLIAAPAVAFRSELDDLWAGAEPDKNLYVRAIAACGQGTFTLEMDPERGAVVRQDGQTLARATMTEREIECDVPIRAFKSIPDEFRYSDVDQRSYASSKLTCETGAPLDIVVNPIWYHDVETGKNRTNGTTLLVAERGTRRTFASAVLRRDPYNGRNWSAVFWDSSVCSARR